MSEQEPPSPQPSPPAKLGERELTEATSVFRTCVTCPLSPGFAGGEGWGEGALSPQGDDASRTNPAYLRSA
jgi:hypothetical protein